MSAQRNATAARGMLAALLLPGALAAQGLPPLAAVRGQWDAANGVLRPDPAAVWSLALTDKAVAPAVSVAATITIADSGVVLLPHSSEQRFWLRGADRLGENDLWADAALVLCYRDAQPLPGYYRVEISAHPRASHVAIWKTGGGYVAAAPLPVALKTPHTLRAETDGKGSLRVSLDDREVLVWRDPQPLPAGRAGVAALKAIAEFAAFEARPASGVAPVPAAAQGDFHLRPWYAGDQALEETWLFDGVEPVFRLHKNKTGIGFQWVKLRPGVTPPVADLPWFWTQYTGEDTDVGLPDGFEVTQEGSTWACAIRLKPRAGDGARATFAIKLQRDTAANRYVYEVETTLTVGAAALPYRHPYEFFDPWPAAAKGRTTEFARNPRQRWEAFAWEQPDGRPPRRVNFSSDYLAFNAPYPQYFSNSTVRTPGLTAMGCEPDVNMVIHYRNDPGQKIYNEMCAWGYDWHQRLANETWRKGGIPAGSSFNLRFALTHESRETLAPLFAAARHISAETCQAGELPAFEWPCSTFGRTLAPLSSRNVPVWLGGTLARDDGHGDRASLRLAPGEKGRVSVPLGVSYFFPPDCFGPWAGRLSLDLRAPDGPGQARVTIRQTNPRAVANERTFEVADRAWQSFSMNSDALIGAILADLEIRNVGATPLALDNVRISEPPPPSPPTWTLQAEMLNPSHMVADADAVNGYALAFGTNDAPGACVFGPYDAELPAGDYVGKIRIQVPDNATTNVVAGWDMVQSEGAVRYGIAGGDWRGTDFAAAGRYVEQPIAFHRDAGGRLSIRFYQRQPGGQYRVDRVTLRRVRDAWGNPLPEARDRW
jgi:hypothetical protein